MNINAVNLAINRLQGVCGAGGYTPPAPRVAAPVFSPVAGSYVGDQDVTMTTVTAGATIYYTDDGSPPTALSTEYTAPVTLTSDTTLKAIAINGVIADSNITTGVYVIASTVAYLYEDDGTTLLYEDDGTTVLTED